MLARQGSIPLHVLGDLQVLLGRCILYPKRTRGLAVEEELKLLLFVKGRLDQAGKYLLREYWLVTRYVV